MTTAKLHYIYDPLCGWCYAARPLVEAAQAAEVKIVLHGGGLWAPATKVTAETSDYIRRNDQRIAALTNMEFSPAYLDAVLNNRNAVLWSQPTIAAVLAAGTARDGADLSMMHAIQAAHYTDGKRVIDVDVLSELVAAIGLAVDHFKEAFKAVPVREHIDETRQWMRKLGLQGFPSFVLERQSDLVRIPHEPFYGKPDRFAEAVLTSLAASPP